MTESLFPFLGTSAESAPRADWLRGWKRLCTNRSVADPANPGEQGILHLPHFAGPHHFVKDIRGLLVCGIILLINVKLTILAANYL